MIHSLESLKIESNQKNEQKRHKKHSPASGGLLPPAEGSSEPDPAALPLELDIENTRTE